MMPFEIVTYCSENYKDSLDFTLPSWLTNSLASKITIYTDSNKIKSENKKIQVIPFFPKDDDWVVNVGRKTSCIVNYLQTNHEPNFAFLESDCYVLSDFSEIFLEDFDLAVTRMFSKELHTYATITSGVWFTHSSPKAIQILKDWNTISKQYYQHNIGINRNTIAYDQLSFTDLIRPLYAKNEANIYPLEEDIYNSEHSKLENWIIKLKKTKPKILHFKGQKFRDKRLVHTVFKYAK